jgi:bacillithiol biosynthesis deacetylase BshB1
VIADAIVPCAALAVGPHPDDVEIAAAGTLLKLRDAGMSVGIVDCTRGEMGSRGTPQERADEAAEAARLLGCSFRANLGLPDTGVRADDDRGCELLVAAIRRAQPKLLLGPLALDAHPDHVEAARLLERAWFLAGLVRFQPALGAPHRPKLFLRYPGNRQPTPTLVVDVGAVADRKAAIVRCYRSQTNPPDRSHLVLGLDVVERAEVRDRFHGASIGATRGEAFVHDGPLPVGDLAALLR